MKKWNYYTFKGTLIFAHKYLEVRWLFGPEVAGWAQTEWISKCYLNNFTFDNYCLKLIIVDDYMQPFVPIMWDLLVSKLKFGRLTNSQNYCVWSKMTFFTPILTTFLAKRLVYLYQIFKVTPALWNIQNGGSLRDTLNQWRDFDHTCIDTLLEGWEELIRFWWPCHNFQIHYRIRTL